jgi:hypothetical protein
MNAYGAYSLVAAIASAASLLIGLIGMKTYNQITDSGLWAIAVMVAAPMAMAIGVSFFINRTHCAFPPPRESERRLPPDDPYGEGSFAPVRRG